MSLQLHDLRPGLADFRAEVLAGLAARPRQIAPKFFYDAKGSALFDAITELPEYYPTRTEISILEHYGDEIAELLGPDCFLLELGSGSSRKIRVLLESVRPQIYMPIDISGEHLNAAAATLAQDFPAIEIHAVCADYSVAVNLPEVGPGLRRVAFYPGSSIGNFDPAQAAQLLRRVAGMLGRGGVLLVGVDLIKNVDVLNAAYNDEQGVTAAFNLNLLHRIQRELGARLDPALFRHEAFFNPDLGRIEMHLIAAQATRIGIESQEFHFDAGAGIHTENSWKYSLDGFKRLAQEAGLRSLRVWTDPAGLFSVHALTVPD